MPLESGDADVTTTRGGNNPVRIKGSGALIETCSSTCGENKHAFIMSNDAMFITLNYSSPLQVKLCCNEYQSGRVHSIQQDRRFASFATLSCLHFLFTLSNLKF